MAGFISPAAFNEAVRDFHELAQRVGLAPWSEAQIIRFHGEPSLRLKANLEHQGRSPSISIPSAELEEDCEDADDELLEGKAAGVAPGLVTCDVIRSASYQVPVLYLSGVSIDLLRKMEQTNCSIAGEPRAPISFVDHPWTNTPVHAIHPCRTAESMAVIASTRELTPLEFLVAWFGLVGRVVDLHVPHEIALSAS
ncbi:hypothetical protein C1H76_5034 [Elsinoe australis]|uniref:Ubiquitin-like-conjugating enzyme ATG10 n=1 Tax=Elsinoe australis TaxID=40998 RepID=A0A4U7B5K8_9PEZI|nr:hypothetical protein C1H76_5034 [Elsinoe australis]